MTDHNATDRMEKTMKLPARISRHQRPAQYRRLFSGWSVLCLLLLLLWALPPTPAGAQDTPTPTSTSTETPTATSTTAPASTETPTLTVTPAPSFKLGFTAGEVAPGSGTAKLTISISNATGPWPGPVRLLLDHPSYMRVREAQLDGQPLLPIAQADTRSQWEIPAPAGSSASSLIVVFDLPYLEEVPDLASPFTAVLSNIDGDILVPPQDVPQDIRLQLENARPEPTPTPTQTPLPTDTPTPTVTPPPATATATPAPTATATPAGFNILGGSGSLTNLILLGGLLLLGLLLLVVFILLLLRLLRRKPKPPAPRPAPKTPPTPLVPPPPPAPQAFLVPHDKPNTSLPLGHERFTIGRAADNNLVIDAQYPAFATVSNHHATIYRQDDQYVIEDLDSQNGVWVNGRATAKNALRDGWQVALGGVTFTFQTKSAAAAAPGRAGGKAS